MKDVFIDDGGLGFITELFVRTLIMFVSVLIVLRLSGRRGVRQLSLFEVAIILSMGSAAGDPMFQKDVPLLYGIAVLLAIVVFYKASTFLASKNNTFHVLLEGKEMLIVKDGVFDIKHERDNDFSQKEFFSELRNLSVEHLGQVREAILETDGSLSVLFYADEDVRYGLPLFPSRYVSTNFYMAQGPFSCMFCGNTTAENLKESVCPRCNKTEWALAINTKRIG